MANLKLYFDEIVNPTIQEFAANPRSVRLAFLSCVVVFHAIDYIKHPKSAANLRKTLRDEFRYFELVDRVAHAFKHVESDGQPETKVHAEQIISRPPLAYGIGAYGLSQYGNAVGGVTLDNARLVDLLDVVKRTRDFLCDRYINSSPSRAGAS